MAAALLKALPPALAAVLSLSACGNSGVPAPGLRGTATPPAAPVAVPVTVTSLPPAQGGCIAEVAPRHSEKQLRRDGRWMLDDTGRVVLSHGINTVWKIPPYYPPASDEGFQARDAEWLANNGFNSARIGSLFVGVMPRADRAIDQGYLAGWDRVVQLLAAQKIWVLFDFHQDLYSERFQGEGFPDWAVYDDGIPLAARQGFPGNYLQTATSRAFDNLWANANNLQQDYGRAWQAVASKWKSQPYSMGYDLINEPWPGNTYATCASPQGCPVDDATKLQPFMDGIRAAIRSVDSNNLIWFEPWLVFGFGANNNFNLVNKVSDPQLGFSWHDYCLPGVFAHSGGASDIPGCAQLHSLTQSNAEGVRSRLEATTLLTEFGASDDLVDIAQATQNADANLTGWQYWHYKNWHDPTTESQSTASQSLFTDDSDFAKLKVEKARILIRPYPQYTAGLPTALSFDTASEVMHFSYTPRQAAAPTEIYVPTHLHYRAKGYRLTLTGATQAAGSSASRLLLDAMPGACSVSVDIAPL